MNDAVKHLFDWCHEQRIEAEKSLKLYEEGKMRFLANNVDVTDSQKASLKRIIEEMGNVIARIKADHADAATEAGATRTRPVGLSG